MGLQCEDFVNRRFMLGRSRLQDLKHSAMQCENADEV